MKPEDIKNRDDLLRFELNAIRDLIRYLRRMVESTYKGLSSLQVIALASLARGISAVEAALVLLETGEEQESSAFVRIMFELAHRFAWLIADPAETKMRVEVFLYNVMRDDFRRYEAMCNHPAPGLDLAKLQVERDVRKAEMDAAFNQLKADFPEITKTEHAKIPKLEAISGETEGSQLYANLYQGLSLREHSEGYYLSTLVYDAGGAHGFRIVKRDSMLSAHILALHFYLVHLAKNIGRQFGPREGFRTDYPATIQQQEVLLGKLDSAIKRIKD